MMIALFASVMFTSALLLFWVQPMFTKAVLPLLGGTPAVWNTALVFFQAALLTGYLYAHLSSRWLGDRRQPLLHLAVLASAALVLPIGIPEGWRPPMEETPVAWLLALLAITLGPPFVALSATAPLLQRWFATTGHPEAHDPYFLYATSNLGSMVALIGYPIILEPLLGLKSQQRLWSAGFLAVALLIAAVAWVARRRGRSRSVTRSAILEPPLGTWTRARWVLLAFAPSSLLLGVTTYITTDLAAVPLLWVLPLTLYLLTFVIVFSRRPAIPHAWMIRAMPYAAIVLAGLLCVGVYGHLPIPFLLVHLAAFFVLAMVCHGELAQSRPDSAHLTEYYLWVSLGGVLGGAFNALVAPVLFDSVAEYPVALVLAVILAPFAAGEKRRFVWADLLWPAALVLLSASLVLAIDTHADRPPALLLVFLIVGSVAIFAFRRRPLRLGLGVGALLLSFIGLFKDETILARERSFFGISTVLSEEEGRFHVFRHGSTVHGVQQMDRSGRPEPISYYVEEGPVGDVFARLADRGEIERVAGVGLGTGSIACYGAEGEAWTFYEIDPLVDSLARDTTNFTYLSQCAPDAPVVFGDARLSLVREPDAGFDLIVVDVFTSDAIPVHMMTREAFRLYLDKLAPEGIVLMNISNSFLHLRPVVAAAAADLGIAGRIRGFSPERRHEAARSYRLPSEWVVLARGPSRLSALDEAPGWEPLVDPGHGPWTDDHSNIVQVLRWTFR